MNRPMMRFAFHCLVVVLVSLAPASNLARADAANFGRCATKTTAPEPVQAALDEVLDQILESKLGAAPGAVLSVRGPDWRYVKSKGIADQETGQPIDCSMPFQIGSNTKMMTAAVLLQLHEEGALSVDDLLSVHLPDIAASLPEGRSITLRQLAQHTSGVFNYTDNATDGTPGLMEVGSSDPAALRRHLSPEEMIDFVIKHGSPGFAPGKPGAWVYSNTGYVLLGMVIEKIEGTPLAKSFENRIFGPLGMRNSYLWDDIPRASFGLPRTYLKAPFDYETTQWNMSQGSAAGAVISTVDDMHTFIDALVSGKLFRSEETLSMMKNDVRTTNPLLLGYGLGLARKGERLWGHGGQTMGFESDIAAFEDNGISIVAWGTTSENILVFGAGVVTQALQKSGAVKE